MRIKSISLSLLLLLSLVGCRHPESSVDGLKRSKVDALNKASFKDRFNDAARSEQFARRAVEYVCDSLPEYDDGLLRSWNNLACSFSNRAMHDSANVYVDSVLCYEGKCNNKEVEQTLARLIKARLLQRNCDIAGSYRILYDIENSGILNRKVENRFLYDLVKSEFYITTTTLNYHYRNKSQYQQSELMTRMEGLYGQLRCDFAEDMSFNYAIAYGYYALCNDSVKQKEYLCKALHYCMENLMLLADSTRFSTWHLADTYQMLGFMLWSPSIGYETWSENASTLGEICDFVEDVFNFSPAGDSALQSVDNTVLSRSFLTEATSLFFLHDDPYQRLAAIVATGRFCMAHGDTLSARDYFSEALVDTTLLGVAPKLESMLYEGLLTSGCATSQDEVAEWSSKVIALLNYIKQNEKADFLLQLELNEAHQHNITFKVFILILFVMLLGLVVSLILLRRRTKALQHETEQLQNAQKQDVERIANVETCLSVLRHDINPFISYLQNDNLPDELKREVTSQLIRTFENIKNWTNLSIPSGLQFRCTTVGLQEVFDSVEASVNNFRGEQLKVSFAASPLIVTGDRQLLEILLRNLVNNAIQHTEQGEVRVTAIRYSDDERFVEVAVADTGCGMTNDEIENLFRTDKKARTTPNDAPYGSGFGLILCRYIIKKHDDNTLRGCRIWAESVKGEGSVFHFLVQSSSPV